MKRSALNEMVEFITTQRGVISEAVYPEVSTFAVISSLLSKSVSLFPQEVEELEGVVNLSCESGCLEVVVEKEQSIGGVS